MPTYEYSCNECGYQFEYFQKMTDEPITNCPQCSGSVTRLIGGGAGLIFKGSGFYITDYKKKNISKKSSDNDSIPEKKKNMKSKSVTKADKSEQH
ncbi:MAG: FmdB family zinc ribbon protein [Fidelibacterota bacterium]